MSRPSRPLPRASPLMLIRVFLLALAAVAGAAWAVAHYYARGRAAIPAPPPAASEIPAPSVIPVP